jgi:hypothetical protein
VSASSGFTSALASASFFVFGGAVSVLQLPQIFSQQYDPMLRHAPVSGSNLTVAIVNSKFSGCRASTSPSSVAPGAANGGGGAVYARSAALSNFTASAAVFIGSNVSVTSGSGGYSDASSYSSGGALAVDALGSNLCVVEVHACNFSNCKAEGARIPSIAVRGGAVSVSRATSVAVRQSTFVDCQVSDALVNNDVDGNGADASGAVVSGGAAVSIALVADVVVEDCEFNATGGRDSSSTSTGLLVLASNSFASRVRIAGATFRSNADPTPILRIMCVLDNITRSRSIACAPSMQSVSIADSSVIQPERTGDSLVPLIAVRSNVSSSFSSFKLHCWPSSVVFKSEDSAFVTISCGQCRPLQIAASGSSVLAETLDDAANFRDCMQLTSTSNCPFGTSQCTTFLRVRSGFWSNFTSVSSLPLVPERCPPGYCRCESFSCELQPLLTINRSPNRLCTPNRVGRLCGGCRDNFTQSIDGKSCIDNEVCRRSLWWVWTLSILGYAAFGFYIVASCQMHGGGGISCLLFYFQMSTFAVDADESSAWFAALEYAQMRPIFAWYKDACYAPNMGAYDATAFKLVGPLFVLLFALAWTRVIKMLQPQLQQRSIHICASYSGTIASTVLYVYSSVATVVFSLLECTDYSSDDAVVFIDGTVRCKDTRYIILCFVAALLFLFPVAFAAALRLKKLPQRAQLAVCGKFTERVNYWGAVTLSFRLLISATQFLRVQFPNLLASIRSFLSIGIFCMLVTLRPYINQRTFWVDAVCHLCLNTQFVLQIIGATRDYLAVTESTGQTSFFEGLSKASQVMRWAPFSR